MKLPRRQFLRLTAGAAAASTASHAARAQDYYPTGPVRIIVGFSANGPTDFLAHLIGQWLSKRLRQPFVVENRVGAGSTLSIEAVANAPPDGYTLLLIGASAAASTTLYPNPKFNLIRDIAPVSSLTRVPLVMQVNPSLPAKTVPEFIAYAKANSSGIAMTSIGDGTTPHLAAELFNMMAGTGLLHVSYNDSASALTGLLQGQVQVYFGPVSASVGYIRTDKLRALAVTSATRSEALPDVPTIGESVPGYEAIGWYGVGVPKKTPSQIIDKLSKEINAALADPKMKAQFAALGAEPMPMTPTDFGKFIAEETEKWAKVIKFANIKPE